MAIPSTVQPVHFEDFDGLQFRTPCICVPRLSGEMTFPRMVRPDGNRPGTGYLLLKAKRIAVTNVEFIAIRAMKKIA